jgi:phage baseplate assembly protein gpV
MNMIDINSFYHRAKEKGLVRDEKVRLMLAYQTGPKIGVNVKVMLDYNLTTSEPDGPKNYAYGATILFDKLTKSAYDYIVSVAKVRYGDNDNAQNNAAERLLMRSDVVLITKDESLLKHPYIKFKLGAIGGRIYGGGDVNGATPEAIAHLQKEVTGAFAFEDKLYDPVNPAWLEMDKKKNREHYSEMAM